MKHRGLVIALLAGYFLSCSTFSSLKQGQYYAPKKILVDMSDGVSLLEDTDGDGIYDTRFNYEITLEEKPDYISGDSKNFYFIEGNGVGTIVPLPLNKNQIPAPVIPEYKNNPFKRNLRLDARFAY